MDEIDEPTAPVPAKKSVVGTRFKRAVIALGLLSVAYLSFQYYRLSSIPPAAVLLAEKEATFFADAWIASSQVGAGKIADSSLAAQLLRIVLSGDKTKPIVAFRNPTTSRGKDLLQGELIFGWDIVSAANQADMLGYLYVDCSPEDGGLKLVSIEFIAYDGHGVTDEIE